ncbi:MAG: hypothetical protein ACI8RZ_005293 [Myxococcota bacterium]|jgi:hypothetical protein
MSEDLKRALTLGGGGLIVAAIIGGGWMWYADGQRRSTLSGDLTAWAAVMQSYQGCLVAEQPLDAEHILLSYAVERTREGRCYGEHLAGIVWSEDASVAPLSAAVTALSRQAPASNRMSELDANETCKQLMTVDSALSGLRESLGEPAGAPMIADCTLALDPWPLVTQPPADPAVPGIRKGALRRVEVRGDRLFASYRMARQGGLTWKVGEADWSVVPSTRPLEGTYWGAERPWGIVPDPEAPAGMIRYRVTAWNGTQWQLRSALPEGLLPYSAHGPGGDYGVRAGPTWLIPVHTLRDGEIALLPLLDEGRQVGEPITLMPVKGDIKPTLQFSPDGTLVGMVLVEDPGGWVFLANLISGEETANSRIFLPVDVPDPLQGSEIITCADGENRFALAAGRWVLKGTNSGRDWRLHHTFEEPLRRPVLACHGGSVAMLGDLDGVREAAELVYSVCDADACREPVALGEQQANGRAIHYDEDGITLVSAMLGYAVIFRDGEANGSPVPERIFSAADRLDNSLPVLSVDGQFYALQSGE